mgnify:CR=1 FL=1
MRKGIDTITPWSVCYCGKQKPREARSCGECPQRRASLAEETYAYERGNPLPSCFRCDSAIMPAIGPCAPSPDKLHGLLCLECARNRQVRCECPKHNGNKLVHEHRASPCAWVSRKYNTRETVSKLLICETCARRHNLLTWQDYCAKAVGYDENGEVRLLQGESGRLRLEGDPFKDFGGEAHLWSPARGITGTWVVVDGVPVRPWVCFLPNSFRFFQRGSRSHRIVTGVRYNPANLLSADLCTVWHSGVNAYIDTLLDPSRSGHALSIRSVGWLYVRVCGVVGDTSKHDLYFSRYSDDGEGLSLHQWVSKCHKHNPRMESSLHPTLKESHDS